MVWIIKMSCPRTDSFTSTRVSENGIQFTSHNKWVTWENERCTLHIYLCLTPDKLLTCPTRHPSVCRKKKKHSKITTIKNWERTATEPTVSGFIIPAGINNYVQSECIIYSLVNWVTGELNCSLAASKGIKQFHGSFRRSVTQALQHCQ